VEAAFSGILLRLGIRLGDVEGILLDLSLGGDRNQRAWREASPWLRIAGAGLVALPSSSVASLLPA